MEKLNINGVEKDFPQGLPKTLTELLDHLKINSAAIVAEIDGQMINKDSFAETVITTGQTIELIRFAPGG